ncbi:hypothetical protein OHR68_33075 [Spirillospora sp. NBC_00431]
MRLCVDNRVYLNQVSPTGASGFQVVDDMRVTSNIAIRDSDSVNAFEIFARGEDSRVYARNLFVIGSTWKPLDGVSATSDIAVTSRALYVRGGDNAVYANPQNNGNGTFTGFQRVEGSVTGNPAAFTLQPNGGPLTQYPLARQPNAQLAFNIRPDNGAPTGPFTGYTPVPTAQTSHDPPAPATRQQPGDVRLVRVRRPEPRTGGSRPETGQQYSVRWWVDGHWRRYHCGPGRERVERCWIGPYLAGRTASPSAASRGCGCGTGSGIGTGEVGCGWRTSPDR